MKLSLEPIEVFLTMIVVGPAVVAVLTRRFAPRVVEVVEPRIALLSVLCLSTIIIGSVAGLRDHLISNPGILVEMLAISAAGFLFAYALGWFAGARKAWPDRMTVAIVATWTNVGLAIVLANEFFREAMPLVVAVHGEYRDHLERVFDSRAMARPPVRGSPPAGPLRSERPPGPRARTGSRGRSCAKTRWIPGPGEVPLGLRNVRGKSV